MLIPSKLFTPRASSPGKWVSLTLMLVTALTLGTTFYSPSSSPTPSVRGRELLMNCVTDDNCPSLYCRAPPCTVFECRNNECLVTTRTTAPETAGTAAPLTVTPQTTAPPVPATTMPPVPVPVPPMTNAPAPVPPVTTAPMTTPAPTNTTNPESFTNPPAPIFAGNDNCASAVGPIPITAQGLGNSRAIITRGTTNGASTPTVLAPQCGSLGQTGPGVWYTVIGTGARMTASTCWPGTNYDTLISVYSRGGRRILKKEEDDKEDDGKENSNTGNAGGATATGVCGLRCVAANDDASGNFGACRINSVLSRVQWESTRGETYYLLVHGFYQKVGDFDLNVITARPMNERCVDATTIPISDQTIVGTTFQAQLPWGPNKSTNCGGRFGLIGDTSSVWYKVRSPTTRMLEASTCHPLTNFDTKIHIFQGSCSSSNSCIGGNDNHNSPQRCSLHTWQAQANTDYYILVHAFMVDNGLFELSVREAAGVSTLRNIENP